MCHAMHTESDENGLAIQKKFQVCGQSFQSIQCFLGPLIYPYQYSRPFFIYDYYKWFLQGGVFWAF